MSRNDELDSPTEGLVPVEYDYSAVEERYKRVHAELERNIAMEEYLTEFTVLHDALSTARRNEHLLREANMQLQATVQSEEANALRATNAAREAQTVVKEMKEAMENAFRRVDAAHAREQQAQEMLAEAERQLTRMRQNVEQTNRVVLESDEFSAAPRSQDEHRQERERLLREMIELKSKLANATAAYDELEKKNMAAGAKMDTMAQHLEILSGEVSKEVRQREILEVEQHAHTHVLKAKDEMIAVLEDQVASLHSMIARLETVDRDTKASCERLSSELEVVSARAQKAQQDYEAKLVRIERLTRESGQKSAALKAREEEISRMRQDVARSVKAHELHAKRLAGAETVRVEVERERDELKALVTEREREAERLRKKADSLKRRLDELCREKDLLAKNLTRTTAVTKQQIEKSKQQEQVERALRTQIELSEVELNRQKARVKKFEKECEKLRTENARKAAQGENVSEQLRSKHEESVRSRREALEVTFQHQHEVSLLEAVRADKEAAERQLVALKSQVDRLQEKLRDAEHKSIQLMTSITTHETLSMKNELALQRAERERESARHELRQTRDQLGAFRERVNAAETEQQNLHEALQEANRERQKQESKITQLLNSVQNQKKQIQNKCEEVNSLKQTIKQLEQATQKSEMQHDQYMEDVKLLKLEIENLRQEKASLALNLSAMSDARQQLFRLQRDITTEQIKCKVLEEELLWPRNIHRWRYLQGEDPDRFELVQRLALAQRRIATQSAGKVHQHSQQRETNSARPSETKTISPELLFHLRNKNKQIKALKAERSMHQAEVMKLRGDVHRLGLQLQELKRSNIIQKKQLQAERTRRKTLEEVARAAGISLESAPSPGGVIVIHPSASNNVPNANKPRFTGGGFNLNVSPKDSRFPDSP